MPGPITAAGAVSNPTKYAALNMGARQMTGLWTQRSPYRDAAVPYLEAKFYSGSRFDSILDGINREISVDLTDKRSPGSIVFNALTFPPAESFYSWKTLRNNVEAIRLLEDGTDGTLYDATPGQKSSIFTKTAGAGPNRMLGLPNAQFYLGNGVDQKKWLFPGGWQANQAVTPGTLINQGAEPGTLYMALGGIMVPIVATAVSGSGSSWQHLVYVNPAQVPINFANLVGVNITFSGLTTDTALNGQTLPVANVLSSTLGIFQVNFTSGTVQAYTPDTGSAMTGDGTAGGAIPTFDATRLAVTQDSGQQWKCYGSAVENTGLTAPLVPPTLTPVTGRFWQPNTIFPVYTSLLDSNGNIEVVASTMGTNRSGSLYPQWSQAPLTATSANVLNQANNSASQTATGDWSLVGSQWRSNFNPGISPLLAFQAFNFGFTIPPSVTIVGVKIDLSVVAQSATAGTVFEIALVQGGAQIGTIKTPATLITTTPTVTSYGGVGDSWSAALTPAIMNDPTFGFAVSCNCDSIRVFLDLPFTVTVYYALAGSNSVTKDGGLTWYNLGQPGTWGADAEDAGLTSLCLIDSNNNLQWLFSGSGGNSGTVEPTWGTGLGDLVMDGSLTWVCISTGGTGVALTYQALQYSYSLHGVDGSLSTPAPLAMVYGGVLGSPPDVLDPTLIVAAASPGMFSDPQIDQVWIWRTAQGQPTLVLEDQIPSDGLTDSFSYGEAGIADTSILGLAALNALIPAPINGGGNPPTPTSLPMCYAFQRVWWADGTLVRYSGGPDTLAANGNTTQPPLNYVPFLGMVYDIVPVTVQDGGLIVFTSSGIQIILGSGTASDPFYATSYYNNVNVNGYNCVCIQGTAIFVLEANLKLSSIAIQYPFNPNTGYTEIGFPIGDQFRKVTTGGISASLYSSATAFLSWNNQSTDENALYVADGAVGWFRMSAVSPPESGLMWHPRRGIVGGTSAVQAVETSPGVTQLLIGPPAGTPGPILCRDDSGEIYSDNGTGYPSWDAKGVNQLCPTGKWVETVHISAKSMAVGARPVVSVLLGEIRPSWKRPYRALKLDDKSNDPARTPKSQSVYSDRYVLKQSGANTLSDSLLTKFDYGTQTVADELLDWGIYAREHEDREEQVANAK